MIKKILMVFSLFLIILFITGTVVADSINNKEENVGFFAKIKDFFKGFFKIFKPQQDLGKTSIPEIEEVNDTTIEPGGEGGNISIPSTDKCVLPPDCEKARELSSIYVLTVGSSINDEVPRIGGGYREYDLTLEAVDETSALLNIDEIVDSINEGERETINGVEIYVCDVGSQQTDSPLAWAIVAVCNAQERVYLCEGEETFALDIGTGGTFSNSKMIGSNTITLIAVDDAVDDRSAVLKVNEIVDTIDENTKETVNGVEIYVKNVFKSETTFSRAILVVGC